MELPRSEVGVNVTRHEERGPPRSHRRSATLESQSVTEVAGSVSAGSQSTSREPSGSARFKGSTQETVDFIVIDYLVKILSEKGCFTKGKMGEA